MCLIEEYIKFYMQKIDVLELKKHTHRTLTKRGYTTIGRLSRLSICELRCISGISSLEADEIINKLSLIGVELSKERRRQHKNAPSNHPYPQNLIVAILGCDPKVVKFKSIDEDQIRGLNVALSALSPREIKMITLRYEQLATLEQIGVCFELSSTRVSQIIQKALYILSRPENIVFIEKGLQGYIMYEVNRHVDAKLKCLIHDEYVKGYNDGVSDFLRDDVATQVKYEKQKILNTPIEQFDLSVRALNCVKRSGVRLVSDLLKFETADSICRIKNLGMRSAHEIATKLSMNDICNDAWRAYF